MTVIQENCSLATLNTFQIDVSARYLASLHSMEDVREFLATPRASQHPQYVLGGGSNLLFMGDYPGTILHMCIRGIEPVREQGDFVWVRAGAGEDWDGFVAWCVERGLGGIENLSLIPGTVGACPVQNIGAYGMEVADAIEQVEAVSLADGSPVILQGKECRFGYRNSIFKQELRGRLLITHVVFRLSKRPMLKMTYADLQHELAEAPELSLQAVRDAVIRIRRRKLPDPTETGNAGSFFKNPVIPEAQAAALRYNHPDLPDHPDGVGRVKLSAAWLIDRCGWKGKREGHVGTHDRQALILVNHGGATGPEVMAFAKAIQQSVFAKFGVELEMEVNVVEG